MAMMPLYMVFSQSMMLTTPAWTSPSSGSRLLPRFRDGVYSVNAAAAGGLRLSCTANGGRGDAAPILAVPAATKNKIPTLRAERFE